MVKIVQTHMENEILMSFKSVIKIGSNNVKDIILKNEL